jgi:hypothetical protein
MLAEQVIIMRNKITSTIAILFSITFLALGCGLPGWGPEPEPEPAPQPEPQEEQIVEEEPPPVEIPDPGLDFSGLLVGAWFEWSPEGFKTGYLYAFYEDGRVLVSNEDLGAIALMGEFEFIGDDSLLVTWRIPGSELMFGANRWKITSVGPHEVRFEVDNGTEILLRQGEYDDFLVPQPPPPSQTESSKIEN